MLRKGLKQVGGIQYNGLLHPYFTLMCNLIVIQWLILKQWLCTSYRCECATCMLSSYTSKWSRDVEVHCVLEELFSYLFAFFFA